MRCESCSAPPSKRRSGPRSLVAKNGDSGSPQRIQNNAASNDVGALLRANTPSIAVASACLAALDSTCVHNQSCNVNASHSAARGAVHGASDGTDSAMVASGRRLAGRAQRVAILEQERVLRDDTPARAPMHGAPSLQLGNSRIPNSSASAAMQSCPGSPTDRHRRRRCRHRSGPSACARQHGSAPPEQARSHHRPQAIVLRKGPKARQCCLVMNGSTALKQVQVVAVRVLQANHPVPKIDSPVGHQSVSTSATAKLT
jgi:hypothetical protein